MARLVIDPAIARKAAAFVEKIARLEEEFDIYLEAGEPVLFKEDEWPSAFGLVRVPGGPLGLTMPEPAAPWQPAHPIHGRD